MNSMRNQSAHHDIYTLHKYFDPLLFVLVLCLGEWIVTRKQRQAADIAFARVKPKKNKEKDSPILCRCWNFNLDKVNRTWGAHYAEGTI